MSKFLSERVELEMARATAAHGPLTRQPLRALAILSEEHGEVAKAVLEMTRPGGSTAASVENLKSELAQVASVALLWLADLEEGGNNGTPV